MLEHIKVRNFQSLHKIDLELAPFTTIVGASSSGKSAFIRACQLLTQNKRGTAFITHGEQTAQVIAKTHRGTVSIKRSRTTTGPNEYTIIPEDGEPQTWTKLHGETPEEVTKFLNIPPTKLNVASQFDPPYLLSDSAPEAARTLGSLTNVHVIMEAARESNKRKLAANADVKRDTEELDSIKKRLPEFAKLKSEEAELDRAEKILAKVKEKQSRFIDLDFELEAIRQHEESVAELEKILAQTELPDITVLLKLQRLKNALEEALASATMFDEQVASTRARQESAQADIVTLQGQHIALLTEAGTCPLCGQSTKELHHGNDH